MLRDNAGLKCECLDAVPIPVEAFACSQGQTRLRGLAAAGDATVPMDENLR